MTTTTLDLQVRIGDHSVTQYQHDGRIFVEAREGTQYALRLKNPHPFRVKAVLSVDGVNVLNGKPATGEREEAGYILAAGETQTIHGYRLDDNEVAAFRFTKAEEGYAKAEKGLTGTTGVIGCRVWREKVAPPAPIVKEIHHYHDNWVNRYPWYWDRNLPWWKWNTITCGDNSITYGAATTHSAEAIFSCGGTQQVASSYHVQSNLAAQATQSVQGSNAPMMMNCSSALPEVQSNPFDAASSFGQRVESKVTMVGFEADVLVGEVTLYYAFRAGLAALGIDLTRVQKAAFPSAFSGTFCSPPKGWVG